MNVVGILGMTHDEEMQKYQFPLSLVKELIVDFDPDIICGEVHPDSWKLFKETGNPDGILSETQKEYPKLIFPLCEEKGIKFIPVNWFERDVFEEDALEKFAPEVQRELKEQLERWNAKQLETWNEGEIPLNSDAYDRITRDMYDWLYDINPDVQSIVWNARHHIMTARVKNAIKRNPGKRLLCIHGADHNYWYAEAVGKMPNVQLKYPLRG